MDWSKEGYRFPVVFMHKHCYCMMSSDITQRLELYISQNMDHLNMNVHILNTLM